MRLRVPKRVKLHETYGSRTPSSGRVGKTEFAQRFFLKASMGYPQAPLFSGSRTIAAVSCIKQLFLCLLLMSAARVHVVFREVAMHVCSKTKMPFLKSRCRIVWRMCARRLRSLIIWLNWKTINCEVMLCAWHLSSITCRIFTVAQLVEEIRQKMREEQFNCSIFRCPLRTISIATLGSRFDLYIKLDNEERANATIVVYRSAT